MTPFLPNCWRPLGRLLATLVLAAMLPLVGRAQFGAGNLVVLRVGDGTTSLGNTGNAIFLNEYTTAGAAVGTPTAVPTTVSGSNQPLISSGSATSEGLLARSADGQYLVLTGYGRTLGGSTSLAGTTSAAVPRVVGRVDANKTVNTSTALTDYSSGNNPRSATSADGSGFFAVGGTGGTRYAALGATTSASISSAAPNNLRQIAIFAGDLYVSTGSGTAGIYSVGAATNTTTAVTPTTVFATGASSSPYGFFLADLSAGEAGLDVAYVADDRTTVLGGIQKWSKVSGTWTLNGTLSVGTSLGARGLAVSLSGSTATLYATTTATTANTLVSLTDASGYNAFPGTAPTVTTLATAPTNTAFRGLAFAPVALFTQTLAVTQGATSYPSSGTTPYSFGNQNLNTNSSVASFTLTNSGPGAVTINSITYGGTNGSEFTTSGTAPTSVAVGTPATLGVVFRPTATGPRAGTVSINYTNGSGTGNYIFSLSGNGVNPANPLIAVSQGSTSYPNGGATAYDFGNQAQGIASTPVTFTVANASPTDVLNISGISTTGNFALSGTAPSTVPANGTATFQLTFTPSTTGTRTGTVSIANDSQANNPYVINLTGTGITPPPTITATSANGGVLLAGVAATILVQGTGFLTGSGVNTVTYSNGTVGTVTNLSSTVLRVNITPAGAGNLVVSNVNGPSTGFALTTIAPPTADLFEPFEVYAVSGSVNTSSYNTVAPASTDFVLTSGTVTLSGTLLSNTDLSTIASEKRNNSQAARMRAGGYIEFARPNGVGTLNLLASFYGTDNTASGGLYANATFTVTYSTDGGTTYSAPVAGAPAAGSLPTTLTPYSFTLNQPGAVRVRISNTIPYPNPGANVARIDVDDVRISNFALGDLTVSTTGQSISGAYNNVTITGSGSATVTGPLTVNTSLSVLSSGTLNTGCQPIGGAGTFTVAAGATLGICDGAGLSASGATGAVQTAGVRSFSPDASYTYNGTGGGQVTGAGLPGTVRTLTVNNADGLTLSQALRVRQVLRLSNGDLDTGGQALTLLSVIGQGTALVDNTGGTVIGAGTMQRAVDATTNDNIGYHQYSAPVGNTTINDLQTPGFDFVLNPAFNTATLTGQTRPYPTVLGYDEARLATSPATDLGAFDKGFFSPASGDAMVVGRGYTASVPNALTVDFVGTFTNGNVAAGGTLTRGSGSTGQEGWQLLGNPYPSPLDWGTVSGAQRVNLDASAYVYHATGRYTGFYTTYLGTLVTNGVNGQTTPIIDAGSGFFARVSAAGTGALNLTNANRVTSYGNQASFGRNSSTRPALRLQLSGAGLSDEATLYFAAQATTGLDASYDATKLTNPNGLNLATLAGTQQLTIDGRPAPTAATVVPLFVGVPALGSYTLTAASLANFGSTAVYLRDALTGSRTLLVAGTAYRFTLASYTAPGRFTLEFAPAGTALATAAQALAAQVQLYPNPAQGRFQVVLPAGGKAMSATLSNVLGQVVLTRTLSSNEADFAVATPGLYTLRLTVDGTTITRKVVVE